MTILTFYNPDTCEEDNQGELGILNLDHQFVSVMSERDAGINYLFLRFVNSTYCDSLKVSARAGTATFRRENRAIKDGVTKPYWYAYKKLKGKLNKVYIGTSECLTEENIEKVVETANKPKEVTQNTCVTKQTEPIAPAAPLELAGHGKNANHLQHKLIPVNQELSMLRDEVEHLKKYIHQETNSKIELGEELRKVQRDRLKIIQERDAIAKDLLVYSTQHRNHSLGVLVAQERMKELEHTVEMQADLIKLLRNENDEALTRISNQESKLNEKDKDIDACLIVYERLEDKFAAYRMFVEKYRDLAKGKDKRNHPRYAYMIDFLAEIDNLS